MIPHKAHTFVETCGHEPFFPHFILAEAAVRGGLVSEQPVHGFIHFLPPDRSMQASDAAPAEKEDATPRIDKGTRAQT